MSIQAAILKQGKPANIFLFIFFSLVTFVLYYTSINNFYVLDDFVRLSAVSKGSLSENFHFFPVPLLLYRAVYLIFGESPVPLRIINYLLNAVMCVLVFRFSSLMLKLFAETPDEKNNRMMPFLASFFFCVHFIHVETIVYYSELHEMLYSVFYIAGLYNYLQYKSNYKKSSLFYVYLFFTLCIFSKETAVTFLICIFLAEPFLFKSPVKKSFASFFPLLLLTAAFILIRYFFFSSLDVLSRPESLSSVLMEVIKNYIFAFTAFLVSLDFVLIKNIYKVNGTDFINTFFQLLSQYKAAVFGIILSFILYFLMLRRYVKLKLVLLAFSIITISSFAWLAGYERYLYLPSAGFCLLVIYWLFTELNAFNKKLLYAILCLLLVYNIYCLKEKQQQWVTASQISKQTVGRIVELTKGLPEGSKVYFKGVPGEYKSAWILRYGIHELPGLFLKREDIKFYYIYQKNDKLLNEPNVYVYDYPADKLYIE